MARNNGGTQTHATPPATQQPAEQPPRAEAQPPARKAPMNLRTVLEQSVERLAAVLPKQMTPERVLHVVTTLVYRTPKLKDCDNFSILAAVMQASALGLDFSPTMGEAYLVPRWNSKAGVNECHFQPGYRGLAKLARNSGAVRDIWAELVHEADEFHYRYTPGLEFSHTPNLDRQRGDVTHAYAVAEMPDGKYRIACMTRDEIESIRKRSQSPNAGPWVTDWGEMAKKTAIRRLCKGLPMSAELATALDADNGDFETVPGSPGEIRARVAPQRGMAGLSSRLALDEPALPPQPTRTYTEAPEDEDGYADEPAAEAEAAIKAAMSKADPAIPSTGDTSVEAWPAGRE